VSQFVADKKINLNGVEYTLKFNFKTILNFEKVAGKNFFRLGSEFSGTDLITLLWACLSSGGHNISVDKTAELVDFSNIGEINKAINELVKSGMPENMENNNGDNANGASGNDLLEAKLPSEAKRPLGNNPPLEEKLQN
jgi:hypothetical protein